MGRRRPGEVHLRRNRSESIDRRRSRGLARRSRRTRIHGHRQRSGFRPRPLPVPRPVLGLRHGAGLDGERRALADRLRRPLQAGDRLPATVSTAAPAPGPRGLPRRCLLPSLEIARTGRQAIGRERRRIPDRPSTHRDEGWGRFRLHPDERDLDHRRPDLSRIGPLLLGRQARDQRGYLGVEGRW